MPSLSPAALSQSIIALLGLQALPDDRREQLIEQMSTVVQKAITLRIIERMPEEERKDFLTAASEGNDILVDSYVEKYVPNLGQIVEEEINKLKAELVQQVNA